jgi:protein involved in temperature-dependent protein secretion
MVSYTPQGSTGGAGGGANVFESRRTFGHYSRPRPPQPSGGSMSREAAERAVRDGQLGRGAGLLQQQVREKPATPRCAFSCSTVVRVGSMERARRMLSVAAERDASALGMAQMYREAVSARPCAARCSWQEGDAMVLGEPDEWLRC